MDVISSQAAQNIVPSEKPTTIRWEVAWMMSLMGLIAYFDRVNFSVAAPMIMEHFKIDKVQFGIVTAAFFIPYMLMQIPSGILAQRYGTRWPIALGLIWWSIFTIATPLAWGFLGLIIVRVLFALGESPISPSMATIIARWSNNKEKAKMSTFMPLGTYAGPIFATPLSVWIITNWSWQAVFYVYGVIGVFVGVLWYWHHRSYPSQHPRINQAEIEYIAEREKKHAEAASKIKEHAPWGMFLKNYRFWAIGLNYYANGYVMFLFLSWLPVYMLEARGMSMKAMGFAAAYPWIAMCVALFVGGWLSDWMIKRGFSRFQGRTIPGFVGFLICGLSLYLGATTDSVSMSVLYLTVALGILGFVTVLTLAAAGDIGKRFGGTVYSWMGFYICLAGATGPIITPLIVKYFGWMQAMNVASVFPIIGGVLFLMIQPDRPLPGTEERLINK